MIKSMMKFRIIFALALIFQLVAVPLNSFANEADFTAPTWIAPIEYLALGDSLAVGVDSKNVVGSSYSDYIAQTLSLTKVLKSFNKGFAFPKHTTSDILKA